MKANKTIKKQYDKLPNGIRHHILYYFNKKTKTIAKLKVPSNLNNQDDIDVKSYLLNLSTSHVKNFDIKSQAVKMDVTDILKIKPRFENSIEVAAAIKTPVSVQKVILC